MSEDFDAGRQDAIDDLEIRSEALTELVKALINTVVHLNGGDRSLIDDIFVSAKVAADDISVAIDLDNIRKEL